MRILCYISFCYLCGGITIHGIIQKSIKGRSNFMLFHKRCCHNSNKNLLLHYRIFGFVAKKKGGNQCLLFAELDPEQPASAIVNFVSKVLLSK